LGRFLLALADEEDGEMGLTGAVAAIGELYMAESQRRCDICYKMRLEAAADACREAGMSIFSTTLLVSPYQRHERIREIGEAAAAVRGLHFYYQDFRSGFRRGQAKAREMGLYRQNYCGCLFSEYARFGGGIHLAGVSPPQKG